MNNFQLIIFRSENINDIQTQKYTDTQTRNFMGPCSYGSQTGTNQIIFRVIKKSVLFEMMKLLRPATYRALCGFVGAASIWKLFQSIKNGDNQSAAVILWNVGRCSSERKKNPTEHFGSELAFFSSSSTAPTLLIYISAINYSYFVPIVRWLCLITINVRAWECMRVFRAWP